MIFGFLILKYTLKKNKNYKIYNILLNFLKSLFKGIF